MSKDEKMDINHNRSPAILDVDGLPTDIADEATRHADQRVLLDNFNATVPTNHVDQHMLLDSFKTTVHPTKINLSTPVKFDKMFLCERCRKEKSVMLKHNSNFSNASFCIACFFNPN
jgi:hypothetical protein